MPAHYYSTMKSAWVQFSRLGYKERKPKKEITMNISTVYQN